MCRVLCIRLLHKVSSVYNYRGLSRLYFHGDARLKTLKRCTVVHCVCHIRVGIVYDECVVDAWFTTCVDSACQSLFLLNFLSFSEVEGSVFDCEHFAGRNLDFVKF